MGVAMPRSAQARGAEALRASPFPGQVDLEGLWNELGSWKEEVGTGKDVLAINCEEECPAWIPQMWGGAGDYYDEEYYWNSRENYRPWAAAYRTQQHAEAMSNLGFGFKYSQSRGIQRFVGNDLDLLTFN